MKLIHRLHSCLCALTAFAAVAVASIAALAPAPARAAAMSDYLETALINHVFRGTAYTAPSTIYVALYTSACSDSAGGTEASGGSYARASVTANTSNWAATSSGNGTTSNVNAINFATPGASWGTVTHFGLLDASTGGNQLVCSALTASKTINSGDTVSFSPGSLTFQIDN